MPRIPRETTIELDRRAWELRQKLYTHERIAAELGVDRSTVTKSLARTNKRYWRSIRDQVDALKAEQLLHLEHIGDEAMQAWRASKQPIKEARKTSRRQAKGSEESTIAQTKEQNGDWHHLQVAMEALAAIRKLMGLDAPTKVAPTTPDGEPLYKAEELSDDELAAIIKKNRAQRGAGGGGTDEAKASA